MRYFSRLRMPMTNEEILVDFTWEVETDDDRNAISIISVEDDEVSCDECGEYVWGQDIIPYERYCELLKEETELLSVLE